MKKLKVAAKTLITRAKRNKGIADRLKEHLEHSLLPFENGDAKDLVAIMSYYADEMAVLCKEVESEIANLEEKILLLRE